MQLTKDQKELVKVLMSEISFFETTNDISSPSHWTLIEEATDAVAENFDKEDDLEFKKNIEECLSNALAAIRKVK